MSAIRNNPAKHRFELAIEGSEEPAAAYYQIEGDRLTLTHTEVPQPFSGLGIGSELARGVFDVIRASGRKAILRCSFMGGFYARHPEYSDIVVG
ncbi:GNAT family N-acetyltransferase [uncultured Sphingobium sp.]|uniref:GNAT family N-acetyltransferase n=1 Tax=uncultured Sphingobium sp. TaxID=316087 RepID=UPI000C96E416|nr:GNAT family N-acetyltransferase [uncultured Sphingobium sp.]MAM38286.1 N-acetyltransferase [Erythrobacter sp.]|tara:strand:- start:1388 stop:1669 length:282 start_codon:yes stop_codon:yes gene_type:complete